MAGATVTWASSNASVATVDAAGRVTAAGAGTATITATAGSASASTAVTVTQTVVSVEVTPAAVELTALGSIAQLMPTALDANGHVVAGTAFSWVSGDSSVTAGRCPPSCARWERGSPARRR